jgi:hypothetical protein
MSNPLEEGWSEAAWKAEAELDKAAQSREPSWSAREVAIARMSLEIGYQQGMSDTTEGIYAPPEDYGYGCLAAAIDAGEFDEALAACAGAADGPAYTVVITDQRGGIVGQCRVQQPRAVRVLSILCEGAGGRP